MKTSVCERGGVEGHASPIGEASETGAVYRRAARVKTVPQKRDDLTGFAVAGARGKAGHLPRGAADDLSGETQANGQAVTAAGIKPGPRSQSHSRKKSRTVLLAEFFQANAHRWVPWHELTFAGACAWRTRVSDCRRQLGMTIECREVVKAGGVVESQYRYQPKETR